MSARERVAGGTASFIDERTGAAKWMKKTLTKVFPDHWSFMLGEIVMYSFVILLLSGTFLTFWFDPSMREVEYEGSYEPLNGIKMSACIREKKRATMTMMYHFTKIRSKMS